MLFTNLITIDVAIITFQLAGLDRALDSWDTELNKGDGQDGQDGQDGEDGQVKMVKQKITWMLSHIAIVSSQLNFNHDQSKM